MVTESYFARRLNYWPMAELVHHTNESADGGVSPFDTAIRGIVAGEDVLIACPYITLEYLESILERAASWRLLTDAEAWLGNYSTDEREAIREFIACHHERIHNVPNLHAKAVVGETGALVGSANLTWTGLQSRDELAVRFEEAERIEELREWFNGLWREGSRAKLDDIDEHIRTSSPVPSSAHGGGGTSISSTARRVASSAQTNNHGRGTSRANAEPTDSHERLVEQTAKAPNRGWIVRHFELLKELLLATEISNQDPNLFMSITRDGKLHTTINNRLVFGIQPFRGRTLFILSPNTDLIDNLRAQAAYSEPFSDGGETAAYLLGFDDGLERVANSGFKRGWMKAILNETDREYGGSPYRTPFLHEPVVYRAAVDHDYREGVLSEAFGEE
jgi:hypothetical protein